MNEPGAPGAIDGEHIKIREPKTPVVRVVPANDLRPAVRVMAGKLHEATDAAEEALLAAGPGPLYQRAGQLVHVARRPARRSDGTLDTQEAVAPVEPAALREALGAVARFERYDARAGEWRAIHPPRDVVETYSARPHWRLPDLHALIACPTLRADGSLLSAAGYDAASGYLLANELPGLAVPERPSDEDAARANDALVEMFRSFPFADGDGEPGVSLAVALAGLLAAIIRPTLPAAPLVAVTAPAAGTGKSYLVDVIATIATGRRAVAVATGTTPEELEKSLGAALLSGRPLLTFDNMTQALGGQLLCIAITQGRVDIRLLGLSKTVEVPVAAQLFSTGNNLRIKGDATRRVLLCRLDAGVERPEQREFETDLLVEAERRRAELVSAALTILRWHGSLSDPAPRDGLRFAGFEKWLRLVRDPLLALGHADPVLAVEAGRATDPDREGLAGLLAAWEACIGDQAITAADVVHRAEARTAEGAPLEPTLVDALVAAVGDRAGRVNARGLGTFLARVEGRILDGQVFRRDGVWKRSVKWRLEQLQGESHDSLSRPNA